MKALILGICCLLAAIAWAQPEKGTGVIYGTVVSREGQPGKRISLYAHLLGSSSQWPSTRSGDQGGYRFAHLPWGRYAIDVEDDDEGYSSEAVEDENSQPRDVEISRAHPRVEFRVVLPPKAGLLEIRLTNRRTGAAIPWMNLSVARTEDPRHSTDSSSNSSIVHMVPPGTNLLVHVTARGFQEWDDSVGKGKPVFVPSGRRLTLYVELEPVQ